MRVVLVFPPGAGATYVPLGIASLAPFVEWAVPGTAVRLVDLNIAAWIRAAGEDPGGQDLMAFVRGLQGNFLDPGLTLFHKTAWNRIRQAMAGLVEQAKNFVAAGSSDPKFISLLGAMTEQVLSFDPELIGVSVLFPEQVPFAAALAVSVNQAMAGTGRKACLVMGGAMMSALSVKDLLTAVPEIDGIVKGEGEGALAALCRKTDFSRVPGLVYRSGWGIQVNSRSAPSLEALPPPDFSRLPLEAYFNPEPVLPVLFSRGCAWRRCRFCSHNFSFGGFRKKNAQAFVSEIETYARTLGVRYFYSADEFIQPEDMDAICEAILARGLSVNLHILGRPTRDCTPGRMALWSAAGCRWIGWGIETGSQRLLDLVNKGTVVPDIQKVLEAGSLAGISNMGLMIFGLPTSTDHDLEKTFEFIQGAYDCLNSLTASAFVLFEQTHFARNAEKYGLHVHGRLEILRKGDLPVRSHRLKFSEIASDGSLRSPRGALEVAAWQQHRRWLGDPPFLEQLPTEHYLIHVSGQWNPLYPAVPSASDPEPSEA